MMAMSDSRGPRQRPASLPALRLLIGRLLLVAIVTVVAWRVIRLVDAEATFPPSPLVAALTLLPVNIACLMWTAALLRGEGRTLRSLFAPRRSAWIDLAWGVLWIAVLYVPFAGAIVATMWLLHGDDMLVAFETVFFDPEAATIPDPRWALALGVVAVVTFAPLNAPAEEAVFRGFAQSRLTRAWGPWPAIAVCSIAFGAQHAFFAPTAGAILVYVVAFTVWGLGSAIIVRAQGRLLPVTIAHAVVNLATSAPAVVFPALQLAGVVPF